jgi:phospho-N-acetylmuramoyl-pentapeptide-transferase
VIAIFLAGGAAIIVAAGGMPFLLRFLAKFGIGQPIREHGPKSHFGKAGTPTMGGIAILSGFTCGYLVGHIGTNQPFSRLGVLSLVTTLAAGAVGLADDWLKVRRQRNLGLRKRTKFGGLAVIAVGYSLAAPLWAGVNTHLSYTRYDVPGISLGTTVWVIFAALVILGSTNAVNLTDGLDGLASGSSTLAFSCLAIIAYWQYRHFSIYRVPQGIDLSILAVSMAGACIGFLWWNAAPARIIMGDIGSLALGACLATLAFDMNLQLLLPLLGGLFVIETISVMLQVASFHLFHRRIFKMAPIHHHFELMGWAETTVTVRFWIASGLFTALSLGLFYVDFLSVGSVK